MWFKDEEPEKYRFERKFVVEDLDKSDLEMIIKLHPAFFTEIFWERQINNIYFDTFDLINYFENVDGQSRRTKVRVRWYGDTFGDVKKPVLEFKIKSGYLGIKRNFRLKDFHLSEDYIASELTNVFNSETIPADTLENLRHFSAALLNRYKRRYFVSADKKFRLTLDYDLEYFALKKFPDQITQSFKEERKTIIEVKYGYNDFETAGQVSAFFPFRMTKSSKYVDGINNLASVFLYR